MLKLYAVFDSKAVAFGLPMFQSNEGVMLRNFSDACTAPDSMLKAHAGDYSLYELGTYDPNSGALVSLDKPVFIAAALSIVAQNDRGYANKDHLAVATANVSILPVEVA